MLQQLSDLYLRSRSQICREYYPNQKRLYALGMEMRQQKLVKPARDDKFRVLRIRVDPNPDFTWPFTYKRDDGQIRYVFFNELHSGVKVLPHMQPYVEWMSINDFDIESYEQVVAGRLSVTGSWFDTLRGLEFDMETAPFITTNAVSCDTHTVLDSSFDCERFVARRDAVINAGQPTEYSVRRGEHPRPFTWIPEFEVWHKDLNPEGLWWPVRKQASTYEYLQALKAEGEMAHVTWNKHNTRLTFGAGVEPVTWQSILLHSYMRDIEPIIFFKGLTDPEFFGIFAPQIVIPGDPHAQINLEGLQLTSEFDMVVVDGQAWTHCMKNTGKQLVKFTSNVGRSEVEKVVMIKDGSSSIPGFEIEADQDYQELQDQGMRISTYADVAAEIKDRAQ